MIPSEQRDATGKVWWNADPDRWHGENPDRFNKTYLAVPGSVFPFLAGLYPETTRANGASVLVRV